MRANYINEDGEKKPENQFLFEIGTAKQRNEFQGTWDDVASIMNKEYRTPENSQTESTWRKRFKHIEHEIQEKDFATDDGMTEYFREVAKEKVAARDQRISYARLIRSQARQDMILDLFAEKIDRFEPKPFVLDATRETTPKAVYVMYSDVHYGLTFDSFGGKYNSEIAWERTKKYANEIIETAKKEGAQTCFVSIMGDMVSGVIHPTIRVENKENLIEQVVGVSELTANFLYSLSQNFANVYVNSVDGNHSRIDGNLENVLRGEKLDSLVPWYCKAKLEKQNNVHFVENEIDSTVGSFEIGNKLYVAVHGDYEKDLKTSVVNIEKAVGKHIDYILAGHLHVPDIRVEDTTYIRNGSVCGSGDDYTMKKRLFSPPSQVFMIVTQDGVESIRVVNL